MQLFQTQNLPLAITLLTCGVPPWEEDGKVQFVANIYTPDLIRGHARYKGWTYEAAVRHAWENGIPGSITYCFQATAELNAICTAFDAQKEAIREAEETPEKGLQSVGNIEIDLDAAGRFAAQWAHNRGTCINLWKSATPMLAYPGPTRTEKHGEKTVATGSLKLVSLNASKDTKSRLRI